MRKIILYVISIGFSLAAQPRQFRDIQHNIELSASMCADDELVVNTNGWQLTAANFIEKGGYVPVRVRISNMSDQLVSISESSIPHPAPEIQNLILCFERPEVVETLVRWLIRSIPCVGISIASLIYCMLTDLTRSGNQSDLGFKIFLFGVLCQALNTLVIAPYDYITFHNLNKQLGGDLRKTFSKRSIGVEPGYEMEKIFLVPNDICKPFEYKVFHGYTDTAIATFIVDIF